MSELLQWFLAVSAVAICGGWMIFVGWMRYQLIRRSFLRDERKIAERESTRKELGSMAQCDSPGIPDWVEAENELIDQEIQAIRRRTRGAFGSNVWGQ